MSRHQIDEALYALLTDDGDLTDLLATATSVFRSRAPEGAQMPYVIFFPSSGTYDYTIGQRASHDAVYTIKVVLEGDDQLPALAIDKRLDELLTDGALATEDGDSIEIRRVTDLDFIEDDETRRVLHLGGTYRIRLTA
jgi:hypothetical protein